jgi:hypothetical protein
MSDTVATADTSRTYREEFSLWPKEYGWSGAALMLVSIGLVGVFMNAIAGPHGHIHYGQALLVCLFVGSAYGFTSQRTAPEISGGRYTTTLGGFFLGVLLWVMMAVVSRMNIHLHLPRDAGDWIITILALAIPGGMVGWMITGRFPSDYNRRKLRGGALLCFYAIWALPLKALVTSLVKPLV